MKYTKLISAFVLCVAVISCRQHDYRTVKIHVPEMKNIACAKIAGNAVSSLPGIRTDKTVVNLSTRTVTVTFESLVLGLKNIEFAIAEAGFRANDVPANPEAAKKLPPECR